MKQFDETSRYLLVVLLFMSGPKENRLRRPQTYAMGLPKPNASRQME